MKRLTCEMCGSTDLVKEDGVFVCQSCGCKYSIEEARKLMVEVTGGVEVKNAAQLENLLKLAESSYASKNYAQAEEFCNQVIAMDDKCYQAWRLKGKAINYQIGDKNQRILETYNCLMTAYRVLPEDEREAKKREILRDLKECMEGEVSFWVEQMEAKRPSKETGNRALSAYFDAREKLQAAFTEFGFQKEFEGYRKNFDNAFIGKCNAMCNSAWKTTVGYNYYRDYFGKGIDPFGRSDMRFVIKDTDLYRPIEKIWRTFLSEVDALIGILKAAEVLFNDRTDPQVMKAIFENIAYFEQCAIPSGCWKITQGFTCSADQYKTVGWHEQSCLTESAKELRRKSMEEYREKARTLPQKVEAQQRAKKAEARAAYWAEHAEEKARLDGELKQVTDELEAMKAKLHALEAEQAPRIDALREKRDGKLDCEAEVDRQNALIRELEAQRDKCGIFKGKEKKAIQERLDTQEWPKLEQLKKQAESAKKAHMDSVNAQIEAVMGENKELYEEAAKLQKRCDAIKSELEKDR